MESDKTGLKLSSVTSQVCNIGQVSLLHSLFFFIYKTGMARILADRVAGRNYGTL